MDESMKYTSYSRNDERFPYSTSGVFYCRKRNEDKILMYTTIICTLIVGGSWTLWYFLSWGTIISTIIMTVLTIAIVLFLIYFSTYIILCGEEYSYKADSDKFIITAPSGAGRVVIIKYSEVENMLYVPILYGNKHRGYKVIIKTRTATYTYEYIMSFFKLINLKKKGMKDTRELPFYIIEERSGLAKKPDILTRAEKYDFDD